MLSQLHLLFSATPLEGAEQMALDEVLLRQLKQPLLRIYSWKAPCVTFGYFQKLRAVQAAFPTQSLVRRWSGGGCVEHGDDLTFSLIIPVSEAAGSLAPSLFYHSFHQAMVAALQQSGVKARLTRASEVLDGPACFEAPRLDDILLEGKKIGGGAQRRCAGSLLHQGSLNFSWMLKDESSKEISGLALAKPIFTALAAQLSSKVILIEEKQEWLDQALELSVRRYQSEEWRTTR